MKEGEREREGKVKEGVPPEKQTTGRKKKWIVHFRDI